MYTQKNSVKRSLITSATALVLSIAMLIGTTFAWFTDSVTSGKNKIVAGNLDVELEYAKQPEDGNTELNWKSVQDSTDLFEQNTLWEPGHTEVVYLRIKNAGTLAFDYTLNVSPVIDNDGINKDGKTFKLSDYLVFGTTDPSYTEPTAYASREEARKAVGSEQKLKQTDLQKTGTLLTKDAMQYTALVVYMPEDVGNEANYGSVAPTIDLGLTLYATQAEHEEDSFGKDYDAAANLSPDSDGKQEIDYKEIEPIQVTASVTRDENGKITGLDSTDSSYKITKYSNKGYTLSKFFGKYARDFAYIPLDAIDPSATEISVTVTSTDTPAIDYDMQPSRRKPLMCQ